MPRGIYLDNNMATRPSVMAVSKMMPYLSDHWGHPSAPHQMGQELYPALEQSYKAIYKMLQASNGDTFIFTSSGAEAVNHVFFSAYEEITRTTGKNHYITSNIDEAPAIMSIGRLERFGCVGKMVQANQCCMITSDILAEFITPRTALVSLSWANGLTGVINPVAEIGKLCKMRGIALHLDATHVLGKTFYEAEELGASFLTFNGGLLHAPKGTGGLWIKEGVKSSPFIVGGIEQNGLRGGCYNIPGLIALGQAAEELIDSRDLLCIEGVRLRNKLEQSIKDGYPEAIVFFQDQERLPHCTCIGFPGISNEALLYYLNQKGVYACIGGGCFQQIALVLAGSGVSPVLGQTAISFSLSRETSEEQIDMAAEIIVRGAKHLRKYSKSIIPQETP